MELKNVAKRFDTTPMWESYTGKKLRARCQITPWDNPRRDGLTTVRRTISVEHRTLFPLRRAIYAGGAHWIVGDKHNPDTLNNSVTRVGYIVQQAEKGLVGETSQVLENSCKPTFMSRVWVKDVKDVTITSETQSQYFIYYVPYEDILDGSFIQLNGRWHIVHNTVTGVSGLNIAYCSELERDCVHTVKITTDGEWNPITESYAAGVSVSVKCIVTTPRDDFSNQLASRVTIQLGDVRLRFQSGYSQLVDLTTTIDYLGDIWQVIGIQDRTDESFSALIRRLA